MEGNFLSRYKNKLDNWSKSIEEEPHKKSQYEAEMSEYLIKCMPYMNRYIEEDTGEEEETNTDNVFNVIETNGIKRKDIFTDYLIDVEKKNLYRHTVKEEEVCTVCEYSNIIYFSNTSDAVCDSCGLVVSILINEEPTYKEEQEIFEKIINYSYKRENHFNEWLSQFQAQEMTTIPPEVIEQLRLEFKKIKIKKLDEITHTKIRQLLKKLKWNKYYEWY
jgi:hypothetical protein